MERLKVFEGVPPPYDKKKRMVVPQALRVLRLKPGRKFCTVGRLSHEVGWKYQDVVARWVSLLNDNRKTLLTALPDSRRDGKSRVPPTTRGRRLPGDSWLRPRRPLRLTRRSRTSLLSMVTRGRRFVDLMKTAAFRGRLENAGMLDCKRHGDEVHGFAEAGAVTVPNV